MSYIKIKKKYEDVVALKSKSGIKLVWSDEKGMDVTLDRQAEWDDLVRVRVPMSSLSTMSD